ncbi:MAG: MerR family transcriptional regulator [Anaerolineaceae bacterium]|nr:MerR family transcriptional regulator [Anaerolineaceae bacterium]
MFKIGEFSRISQVSVKTLRYYDEIGLLKPSQTDPFSSYRYYTADQMSRLNKILALKDLGLTLEQIAQLMKEDLPPPQLRGMLRLKQIEIQQRLEEEQTRLDRVETRLRQIETEDNMSAYEIVIKKLEPQLVCTIHDTAATYSSQGPLWRELAIFLSKQNARACAPSLTIYYDTEYREQDIDLEVATPISVLLKSEGRVTVREMSGCTMAYLIHQGSYDTINQAYQAIITWIEANGYRISGPNREIYLQCPNNGYSDPTAYNSQIISDPNAFVTEIQFPFEKIN